jgi:hypothetical protein
LASEHPYFEDITADVCNVDLGLPLEDARLGSVFVKGTFMRMLQWNPQPWDIPSDGEMYELECLFNDSAKVTFQERKRP